MKLHTTTLLLTMAFGTTMATLFDPSRPWAPVGPDQLDPFAPYAPIIGSAMARELEEAAIRHSPLLKRYCADEEGVEALTLPETRRQLNFHTISAIKSDAPDGQPGGPYTVYFKNALLEYIPLINTLATQKQRVEIVHTTSNSYGFNLKFTDGPLAGYEEVAFQKTLVAKPHHAELPEWARYIDQTSTAKVAGFKLPKGPLGEPTDPRTPWLSSSMKNQIYAHPTVKAATKGQSQSEFLLFSPAQANADFTPNADFYVIQKQIEFTRGKYAGQHRILAYLQTSAGSVTDAKDVSQDSAYLHVEKVVEAPSQKQRLSNGQVRAIKVIAGGLEGSVAGAPGMAVGAIIGYFFF